MTTAAYHRVLAHMRSTDGWQTSQGVAKASGMTNREASQYLKILAGEGFLESVLDTYTNLKLWRVVESAKGVVSHHFVDVNNMIPTGKGEPQRTNQLPCGDSASNWKLRLRTNGVINETY